MKCTKTTKAGLKCKNDLNKSSRFKYCTFHHNKKVKSKTARFRMSVPAQDDDDLPPLLSPQLIPEWNILANYIEYGGHMPSDRVIRDHLNRFVQSNSGRIPHFEAIHRNRLAMLARRRDGILSNSLTRKN